MRRERGLLKVPVWHAFFIVHLENLASCPFEECLQDKGVLHRPQFCFGLRLANQASKQKGKPGKRVNLAFLTVPMSECSF